MRWWSSTCPSAPMRHPRSRPSPAPRACSRRPAAAPSSSKGDGAWPKRSVSWSSAAFRSWRMSDWGRSEDDARAVSEAGAFAVVIEAVAEPLARRLTGQVPIPTIGIGASAACDGQVLVLEDMLGLTPRVPKFVKRYGDLGPSIERAVAAYASEVRARAFPAPEHTYPMKKS